MKERSTGKTKAHTIYKCADGKRVPGVTTITGVLNKPALVKWANNLGLKGIDSSKFVDEKAAIGTLAHHMIEAHLTNKKPNLEDYSKNQIDMAENSVLKFFSWQDENELTVIGTEMILVSEAYRFGGQCDLYCVLNGKKTLIDLKTSKGIFPEHFTQVSAYWWLLDENWHEVEDVRILRIGRDESEGFDDIKVPKLDLHWERFKHCLAIYNINKELNGR